MMEDPEQPPAASPSVEKRSKVSLACDACRASKLRCSGRVPCETCEKRGVECLFTGAGLQVIQKKRGPPRGLWCSIKEENAALKARVAELEAAQLAAPPPQCPSSGCTDMLFCSTGLPVVQKRHDGAVFPIPDSSVMYHPPPLSDKVSSDAFRIVYHSMA